MATSISAKLIPSRNIFGEYMEVAKLDCSDLEAFAIDIAVRVYTSVNPRQKEAQTTRIRTMLAMLRESFPRPIPTNLLGVLGVRHLSIRYVSRDTGAASRHR